MIYGNRWVSSSVRKPFFLKILHGSGCMRDLGRRIGRSLLIEVVRFESSLIELLTFDRFPAALSISRVVIGGN